MINYLETVEPFENEKQILAIEYVPVQKSSFENLFDTADALIRGTVFPELYMPFCGAGGAK